MTVSCMGGMRLRRLSPKETNELDTHRRGTDELQPASPRSFSWIALGLPLQANIVWGRLVVPPQLLAISPQLHQFRIQEHATSLHVVTPSTESGGELVPISPIPRFQLTAQSMQL